MHIFQLFFIVLLLLFSACTQEKDARNDSKTKKTYYGKTIQKTQDLSKELSKRDLDVERQSQELFDD